MYRRVLYYLRTLEYTSFIQDTSCVFDYPPHLSTQHTRGIFIPSAGIEPVIPATERLQVYVVEHMATGIPHSTPQFVFWLNLLLIWLYKKDETGEACPKKNLGEIRNMHKILVSNPNTKASSARRNTILKSSRDSSRVCGRDISCSGDVNGAEINE